MQSWLRKTLENNFRNYHKQIFYYVWLTFFNLSQISDIALFHMSINSLKFHFDELETFLANCPIDFQILDITES